MINRRDYFRSYVVVRNEFNLAVFHYYKLAEQLETCDVPEERYCIVQTLAWLADHAYSLKSKMCDMNYRSTLTMTKEEFAVLRLKWEKTRDLRLSVKAS